LLNAKEHFFYGFLVFCKKTGERSEASLNYHMEFFIGVLAWHEFNLSSLLFIFHILPCVMRNAANGQRALYMEKERPLFESHAIPPGLC